MKGETLRTSGQQTKENGSMSFDLTNPLVVTALRTFARKEVNNMPRGYPGSGPRGNPELASKPVAKKAAAKAPAKAVAKKAVAKAPKKKAAAPTKAAKKKAA